MATTVEEALAQQQAVQEAVGMLPQQQQPKQPDPNEEWYKDVDGVIKEQIRNNTPVIRRNMFAQPSPSVQTSGTQAKPSPTDNGNVVRQTRPVISNTDELARAMGYTSPQEEERLRKASVANQRIMAVADAVRHIGNIASAINYAPAMKFNNPIAEEQARYQKGKALRDAANYKYLSYQQQKAAQEAKQRQWEAEQEYKRNKDERDFKFNAAKTASDFAEKQRQYNEGLAYRKANDEANRKQRGEYQDKQIALGKQRIGLGWANHKESVRYHNEMLKQKENGVGRRTSTANGTVFATRNGGIRFPKDYLSKNNINRETIKQRLLDAGIVDEDWNRRFEIAKWTGNQEEMLDEAISDWLQEDDDAEQFLINNLGGERVGDSGSSSRGNTSSTMPGVGGGSAGKMPGVG